MDPNDREDSSRYVNEPRQSASEQPGSPAVAPALAPEPKRKKSRAALILTLLLLLALLGAATFGWLWYQQSGRVDKLEADLSVARNNLASLESAAEAEEKTKENTSIVTETESTDSEAVVKAALAYTEAPLRPLGDQREAKVEYLKNGFAKVIVTSTTAETNSGGTSVAKIAFALTLKESNDDWIVLSAAEGPVADMDELMKTYGIPREAF